MMKRGVITVYLSLVMAVMLSLILVSLESVRVTVLRTASSRYADMAAEMVFSGYTRPAAERYGLFVLDSGPSGSRLSAFDTFLGLNMKEGRVFSLNGAPERSTVSETVTLRDHGWKGLIDQVERCELYTLGEEGLASAGSFIKNLNTSSAGDTQDAFTGNLSSSGAGADAALSAAEEEEKEEKEEKEEASMPDPRPGIAALLKRGLLNTVMEGKSVSSEVIHAADCSYQIAADRPDRKIWDFMNYHRAVQTLQGQDSSGLSGGLLRTGRQDLLLCTYITDHFRMLTGGKAADGEHVLEYEAEYILCGSSEDRVNLENTMTRLFALRTMCNLAYLYTSASKGGMLEEAAAMMALSSIPAVGALIKLLLMLCWACAESLVDCTALARGEKVPMMKTDATWNLSLQQLITLASGGAGPGAMIRDGKSGLGYQQYLFILLALQSREKKMVRMTQIMEKNIRLTEGYDSFSFANCVTGAVFSGTVFVKERFFRHPGQVSCSFQAAYQY